MDTPPFCPVCGSRVPPDARSCPECGACEDTGWSEAAKYENLGIPSEYIEYEGEDLERATRKEESLAKNRGVGGLWWWTVILFIAYLVWRRFG